MASAVTTTSSSSHLPSSYTLTAKRSNRTLRRPLASSASTPNLHAAYSASRPRSAVSPNRAAGAASGAPAAAGAPAASSSGRGRSLSRKPSLAVLSETAPPLPSANVPPLPTGGLDFAILADHTASPASPEHHNTAAMAPLTPGRASSVAPPDTVTVGDSVDVPGNMFGVVRFVGPVQGKKGVFAGVELDADFAPRGKNNGDVDG